MEILIGFLIAAGCLGAFLLTRDYLRLRKQIKATDKLAKELDAFKNWILISKNPRHWDTFEDRVVQVVDEKLTKPKA